MIQRLVARFAAFDSPHRSYTPQNSCPIVDKSQHRRQGLGFCAVPTSHMSESDACYEHVCPLIEQLTQQAVAKREQEQTGNRKHRRAAAKLAACAKPLMLPSLGREEGYT